MDDDVAIIILWITIGIFIGAIFGVLIGEVFSYGDEYGQMICDEKAIDKPYALEYQFSESDGETVACKKKHVERFDGGYVQITG